MSVIWRDPPGQPERNEPASVQPPRRKRNFRGRIAAALTVSLLAAPLAGIVAMGDFASADSGSGLANSPYNAGDGKKDTTPTVISTGNDTTPETGFSNGAKEDDPCPHIPTHGSSPKDDITSFTVASKHAAGITPGDFLHLGWTPATNQGTTTIEFELT